jgi:hypothetical protein
MSFHGVGFESVIVLARIVSSGTSLWRVFTIVISSWFSTLTDHFSATGTEFPVCFTACAASESKQCEKVRVRHNVNAHYKSRNTFAFSNPTKLTPLNRRLTVSRACSLSSISMTVFTPILDLVEAARERHIHLSTSNRRVQVNVELLKCILEEGFRAFHRRNEDRSEVTAAVVAFFIIKLRPFQDANEKAAAFIADDLIRRFHAPNGKAIETLFLFNAHTEYTPGNRVHDAHLEVLRGRMGIEGLSSVYKQVLSHKYVDPGIVRNCC